MASAPSDGEPLPRARPVPRGHPDAVVVSSGMSENLEGRTVGRRHVSNKNESVRMFRNGLLEALSHVHPVTPLVLYVPVVAYVLVQAAGTGLAASDIAGLLVLGAFLWTLTEYVMHRFVFHYQPRSALGRRLHFIVHGVHHDYPNDATRLVMPPGVSIPLALVFYGLFRAIFGPRLGPPAFAGFVAGYLVYDMVHYATHHLTMRGPILGHLKRYHLRHHYQDETRGYGVSSPLWDHVFRTTPS